MFSKLLNMFISASEGLKPFERQESVGKSVTQLIRYIRASQEVRTLDNDKLVVDILQHIAHETKKDKNKEKEAAHVL